MSSLWKCDFLFKMLQLSRLGADLLELHIQDLWFITIGHSFAVKLITENLHFTSNLTCNQELCTLHHCIVYDLAQFFWTDCFRNFKGKNLCGQSFGLPNLLLDEMIIYWSIRLSTAQPHHSCDSESRKLCTWYSSSSTSEVISQSLPSQGKRSQTMFDLQNPVPVPVPRPPPKC